MKKTIITILALSATFFLLYLLFWLDLNFLGEVSVPANINYEEESSLVNQEPDSVKDLNDINQAFLPENKIVEQEIVPESNNIEKEDKDTPVDKLEKEETKGKLLLSVPFIAQAPLGNWSDPRQQDACEEAGVLMAMTWVNDDKEPSLLEAEEQIIKLADWQQAEYGEHRDLHIEGVASRLFGEYFDYEEVEIKKINKAEDLITFLEEGHLILVPTNGQVLQNPYFTPPGPERHLVVIIGYDYDKALFITNDPGTRQGRNFVYPKNRLFEAIRVYPSGYHEPIIEQDKLVLIVSK